MALELSDADFENEVIKSDQPALIDLWAPWCGPCRIIAPVIEKLGEEYTGKAKIFKLNTDENSQTAARYRVQSIPTLLFFKNGDLVEQLVGIHTEQEIRSRLDNLLK